ncbi:hypothetical protein SAMN05216573_12110 [Bradyrhizobium sp. Rc3b]|nr:hypothetical protein SAMN05216573_12110 [Bradyrhizobium sp. Rc3b]
MALLDSHRNSEFDLVWLTEETEKWRTYVDMNPDAFMVLGAITDFGNSRVRVAGPVVDVKNNLEAAYREPETMAQGLANAHDTALRFARSMRRILAGMREIEDRILGNPNAAAILRTFFQDFVDGLLIADYKQLKTSNNPYRHRRTITSLAGDMLADAGLVGKISRAYIEQGVMAAGATIVAAEERAIAELGKIKSVFEDVGPFMDKIEDFRDRFERRIRTTVHYMDIMGEGSAERIVRLIEQLSKMGSEEVEIRLRSPDVGLPISRSRCTCRRLRRPHPSGRASRSRNRIPTAGLCPGHDRVRPDGARVRPEAARVRSPADARSRGVSSSEIEIESIPDFFAYRAIPNLAAVGRSVGLGEFTITLEEFRPTPSCCMRPSMASTAWREDTASGCSACGDRSLLESTGAAAHSGSRRCRAAKGCEGRRNAGLHRSLNAHAEPAQLLDPNSATGAIGRAC